MGIVRLAKGSARTGEYLCRPRLREDARAFEEGALPAQKRTQRRGSVCQWRPPGCPVIIRSSLEAISEQPNFKILAASLRAGANQFATGTIPKGIVPTAELG